VAQVGQSLAGLEATLNQLQLIHAIGTASALLFGLLGGWVFAHLGLRPVVRVTQTARDIVRAEDLSRRVPYSGPADEVGTLATTFNDMLDRLQRLFEGQRRFLAEAAHELRTPLASMLGNVDLLAAFGDDPARREETIAALQRTGRHVARLLDNLLLLAQAESGWHLSPLGPVALDDVFMEAFQAARLVTAARGVALKMERCEPACVRGDPDRLRQVFINLVDNALKHSPPGSAITLNLWQQNSRVKTSVKDCGPGIPPMPYRMSSSRFSARLFASDCRAWGLGLTIVHWIVREHGGEVAIESAAGRGTTVSIWLPEYPSQ
jgi:signal transduction histidine kinase